ncbi:PilT/PilU family type 4a pilus ATPase [Rhodothermus sp. AH-315-K08]|nr:PilT/PilU family type 4a pilus ATPase [Rhodothermus sp. AH-315-K08]
MVEAKEARVAVPPPTQVPPSSASAPPGPSAGRKSTAQTRGQFSHEVPDILRQVAARVPYQFTGDARVQFVAEATTRLSTPERQELQEFFQRIARHMTTLGASDIDFGGPSARGSIWLRVAGDKTPVHQFGMMTADESNVLIMNLLNERHRCVLEEHRSVDFSFEVPLEHQRKLRFRATCYYEMESLAMNMRAITDSVRPLKSMEFHPIVERGLMFRHVRDGLTIVAGVTGSGKSTTMDAIVDANNRDFAGHIVILGQPIEFMHESHKCIVRHREVGRDTPTFKNGITQALRQDPDIVVIGEMRDAETISAGLEITDSGHKVFSTLHTSSAVESIDRIIAQYPTNEQNRVRIRLADVLRCIIAQKLAPRVGGGRVLVKEVLWMDSASRAAIKNDNATEIYQMMWEGGANGMVTLEQDLYRLLKTGLISKETAVNYANNKKRLEQLFSR